MNSRVQLTEYESQLHSVNEALKQADNSQKESLLDLKSKLEEIISLLKGEQDSKLKNEEAPASSSTEKPSIDDEFERFQMEMALLEQGESSSPRQQVTQTAENEEQTEIDELIKAISELEGSKCRAPFTQPWGEKEYHNAVIVATNFDPSHMETMEDVEVEVMFCHPICNEMKPCSFFLNGHCRFSIDQCRFSHGHRVKFSEIQEFILPNYSNIIVDSKCLAQSNDGLWCRATVEKCLDGQKYIIKYDKNKKSETLDAESVIPLDNVNDELKLSCEQKVEHSDFGEIEDIDDISTSRASHSLNDDWNSLPSSVMLWEQHTRGIGSKLMEKMGHVWGQGLGKNSDGRTDPVEAVILPAGKSLDKCIEMRENCHVKGPVAVETRLAVEQDKEEQRAKRVKMDAQPQKTTTVFDFLNSRISKVRDEMNDVEIKKTSTNTTKEKLKSVKDLNIEAFSVGEDIKKARREISRLHQSLLRNTDRNEVMRAQVERKIQAQSNLLKSLQAKEHKINQEIKSQTSHKKLAIF